MEPWVQQIVVPLAVAVHPRIMPECLFLKLAPAAGGTVVLQYMPHELVGHYFVEVT